MTSTGPVAGTSVRVAIVEDETLFSGLLDSALDSLNLFEVVACIPDGDAALRILPDLAPDAVVVDIFLNGAMTGLEIGVALREVLPEVGIVVLSSHLDPALLYALRPESCIGWSFLDKRTISNIEVVARAIEASVSGDIALDESLIMDIESARNAGGLAESIHGSAAPLTARQEEIMFLIAQGYTNAGIAKRLRLSERTVEHHIADIYIRLGIDSVDTECHPRVMAVLSWLKRDGTGVHA